LWRVTGAIAGVVALLFAVRCLGVNVDPVATCTKCPPVWSTPPRGAVGGGKHVNLGARTTWSIMKSVVGGDKTDWKVTDEKEVKEELGKGKLFGARVVSDDFTSCTCTLIGTAAENASLQVGTEPTAQSERRRRSCPLRRASCSPTRPTSP
jgi:hypothetical protein